MHSHMLHVGRLFSNFSCRLTHHDTQVRLLTIFGSSLSSAGHQGPDLLNFASYRFLIIIADTNLANQRPVVRVGKIMRWLVFGGSCRFRILGSRESRDVFCMWFRIVEISLSMLKKIVVRQISFV